MFVCVTVQSKHLSLCLGAVQNGTLPPVQVANVTGTSPVLSANTNPAPPPLRPLFQEAPKTPLKNKLLGPSQNMSNVQSQPKPMKTHSEDRRSPP